jgi:uncharacterized membrane protein YhfC
MTTNEKIINWLYDHPNMKKGIIIGCLVILIGDIVVFPYGFTITFASIVIGALLYAVYEVILEAVNEAIKYDVDKPKKEI